MRLNSSNLNSADYDGNGTLTITFNNDSVYNYYEVPHSEYTGLINASSAGGYLASHIKGRYHYRRIR